jgi:hypothetical protein
MESASSSTSSVECNAENPLFTGLPTIWLNTLLLLFIWNAERLHNVTRTNRKTDARNIAIVLKSKITIFRLPKELWDQILSFLQPSNPLYGYFNKCARLCLICYLSVNELPECILNATSTYIMIWPQKVSFNFGSTPVHPSQAHNVRVIEERANEHPKSRKYHLSARLLVHVIIGCLRYRYLRYWAPFDGDIRFYCQWLRIAPFQVVWLW